MSPEQMREHAQKLVADWPPLTPETRIRIAVLLRPDLPVGITPAPKARTKKAAA